MKGFLSKINPKLYILISGILLGVSIAFAKIGAISYLALIPLCLVMLKRIDSVEYKFKQAYFDGFVFFFSYYLIAFHWLLYFYPLDFTGLNRFEAAIVVALAWVGIPLIQAAFSSLIFVVIAHFSKTRIYKKHPLCLVIFAAALFVINEWSQTFTWAGVPFARISISQTEMPILMQSASVFGGYFLTFIVVAINILLSLAIYKLQFRRLFCILASALFTCNLAFGLVLYFIPLHNENDQIKVAALQGNLPSQEDYGFFLDGVFETYEALIIEAAQDGASLIVLPEGAFLADVNGYIDLGKDRGLTSLNKAMTSLADELDVSIVVGSLFIDENENYYNATSIFYPDGTSILGASFKEKLVPFGEFVPMRSIIETFVPMLSMVNSMPDDLTSFSEQKVFSSYHNNINIGSLICYDSIFEGVARDSAIAGAEIFIVPSDDSWFYNSRALNMHHSQNILRAVEQGRYTISCANTGLTSIVNNKGEIIEQMPIFTKGYVVGMVYATSNRTIYSYIGNLFVYVCILAIALPFGSEFILDKKEEFK